MSLIFTFFFLLIIVFILYDLFFYIKNKTIENQIEKGFCLKVIKYFLNFQDYNENNCANINPSDGTYLNEFCKDRIKCLETVENNVYLTKIFGEMISEIFYSIYYKMGFMGSLYGLVTIFLLTISFKIFSRF